MLRIFNILKNSKNLQPKWKKVQTPKIWHSKKVRETEICPDLDETFSVPKSSMIWKQTLTETFPLDNSTTEKPKKMADHYLKN